MTGRNLLREARVAACLSQAALAAQAGTSRTTLSAYEHGRKSPTLSTTERIIAESGFELTLQPRIKFVEHPGGRGRPVLVPTVLPRLSVDAALATVRLPLHLNWSDRGRAFDLHNRHQRARVYEIVLREGGPEDILNYIDGVLLADLWDELVLPRQIRAAWESLVMGTTAEKAA